MKRVVVSFSILLILTGSILAQQVEYITPNVIDLGRVREGSVIDGKIRFLNVGSNPVSIKWVRTSCGCAVAELEKMKYAPGDTATISFTLNTRGFQGIVRKSVTLSFQEKNLKEKRFIIQANIFSDLQVNPRYIHLTGIEFNPDTVLTEFFTIQNESESPIKLKNIYTNSDMIQVFPQSVVIPPNKEHLLRVELKPRIAGRHTLYVLIETDHKTKPRVNVPVFIYIQETN